jgi:hypothetical protein
MPFINIIKPKNSVFLIWNSHFSKIRNKLYSFNNIKTCLTYLICYFLDFKYIRMLSKYTITNMFKHLLSILFISLIHIASTLVSLKGITSISKCLYLILNAVFYSSPSLILIKLYALCKSSLVKIFAYLNLSLSLLAKGYDVKLFGRCR